jgi:hypothetical protein
MPGWPAIQPLMDEFGKLRLCGQSRTKVIKVARGDVYGHELYRRRHRLRHAGRPPGRRRGVPRFPGPRVVRSIPPFDHEGGTLTFTPSADGTHVDWLTSYTHPAYAGGKLMEAVSRRLLRWSFRAVLAGCAKALES